MEIRLLLATFDFMRRRGETSGKRGCVLRLRLICLVYIGPDFKGVSATNHSARRTFRRLRLPRYRIDVEKSASHQLSQMR